MLRRHWPRHRRFHSARLIPAPQPQSRNTNTSSVCFSQRIFFSGPLFAVHVCSVLHFFLHCFLPFALIVCPAEQVPWGRFFRSGPVLAVTIAHFCFNWGYYTLLSWLPSFFELALNLNIQRSSFLTVIPYVAMTAMTPLVGNSPVQQFLVSFQYRQQEQRQDTPLLSAPLRAPAMISWELYSGAHCCVDHGFWNEVGWLDQSELRRKFRNSLKDRLSVYTVRWGLLRTLWSLGAYQSR